MHGSPYPSPHGGGIRSHEAHGALEPSQWVWCLGTRGGVRAHLGWEASSGAARHVVASEPTSARRLDSMLRDTWWCVVAHPTLCLDLKLVCERARSTGYRHQPSSSKGHNKKRKADCSINVVERL
jgi:hypothetical protein